MASVKLIKFLDKYAGCLSCLFLRIFKIFEGKKIRRYWAEKQEKWFFAIMDIIEILSQNNQYSSHISSTICNILLDTIPSSIEIL